ncbi:DUF4365 domain-containing protein [Streptomyces sp. NPDC004330]|uniref:DUF4365 domain-containing protein n=1 Tax=Streptomyces sp. NPDC004330 TaxID=3364700 RepID=UPI0036ACF64A
MTLPLQREDSDELSIATLSANGAKGRFGVSYVRSIISQAGVGFTETSPDEDVLAVDGSVDFAIASARIQVKCSSRFTISGSSATWHSEVHWRERWASYALPVYFVLVIMDFDDRSEWIKHDQQGTHQAAAAFWVRVNQLGEDHKIHIPKTQRLTAESLNVWAKEVEECF